MMTATPKFNENVNNNINSMQFMGEIGQNEKIPEFSMQEDQKTPLLEASSFVNVPEKLPYSLSKKNSVQMDEIHKEEFNREERIKVLRL